MSGAPEGSAHGSAEVSRLLRALAREVEGCGALVARLEAGVLTGSEHGSAADRRGMQSIDLLQQSLADIGAVLNALGPEARGAGAAVEAARLGGLRGRLDAAVRGVDAPAGGAVGGVTFF